MLSPSQRSLLRALSIGDEASIRGVLALEPDHLSSIDRRAAGLIRLASVIAVDAATPVYQREVQRCLDAGARTDQVLDVLFEVAGQVGASRVITAAPKIAMALGYHVDQGLEDQVDASA